MVCIKKKNKIIAQAVILGAAFIGAYLFFDYLDNRKNENDKPKEKVITSAFSDLSAPRYEYAVTDYVYYPKEESAESMEIPWGDCSNMMYMDFRTLTDTTSAQYELQQYAWTDWQGFRRIGDDYCVALGTYYGQVGDRFRITTDRGNVYSVCMADAKGYDAVSYDGYHTWYHVAGDGRINICEFIVDTYCLDGYALMMGDCNAIDNIGGNIISIERLVDWE